MHTFVNDKLQAMSVRKKRFSSRSTNVLRAPLWSKPIWLDHPSPIQILLKVHPPTHSHTPNIRTSTHTPINETSGEGLLWKLSPDVPECIAVVQLPPEVVCPETYSLVSLSELQETSRAQRRRSTHLLTHALTHPHTHKPTHSHMWVQCIYRRGVISTTNNVLLWLITQVPTIDVSHLHSHTTHP